MVGLPEKITADAFSSAENFKKNALGMRERIDYLKLLKECRAAYFGESHDTACVKNELNKNIEVFKDAGITHVCLEHFPSAIQEAIDGYNVINGAGRDVLEKHLQEKKLRSAKAVMDLVDALKKAGMKVIALGISEQYKRALEFEYDRIGGVCNAKEGHMAGIISELLKTKTSKLIVLTGAPFAQTNHVNERVKKVVGLGGVCARFIGCVKNPARPDYLVEANEAVKGEGLARDSFILRVRVFADAPKFDYLIHLPQVEEAKEEKRTGGIFASIFRKNSLEEEFSDENKF